MFHIFFLLNNTAIEYMFKNMTSLIYLNIDSLEINSQTNIDQTFNLLLPGLKICSSQPNMENHISSLNKINNCSDICFINNIKLDIINNECIYSCKDNGFNYEFANICYNNSCPEDTFPIIRNTNESYNGVILCSKSIPEDYYIDENGIYRKCYEKCKTCYGAGNELNNNCKECKYNLTFINDSIYNNNCYEECNYYYYFNENNEYICTENETCYGNYNNLIIEKNKCIDNCSNDDTFKFSFNNICYIECPNKTIYNETENICIEINIIETSLISTEIFNNYFSSMISSSINYNPYFSTFLNYIKDSTNSFFPDNHNSSEKSILSTYNKDKILEYQSISTNLEENNYISSSINQLNYLSDYHSQIINENNYIIDINITGNNEEIHQILIDNILHNFDVSKEKEMVIKGQDNFIFHLTNMENELELLKGNNNNSNKFSIIDLGQCGNLLKKHYQINI